MDDCTALELFQNWLDSYLNFEKLPQKNLFWLNTMEFLCNRFKNPQLSYNTIHVAGSKGKGSTATFIASILSEYGQRCGLYTSPHILSFCERIGTNEGPLDETIYEKVVQEIMPLVDSIIPENLPSQREPTWFELVTLFSFLCFKQMNAQWAVFETGMGGRLDATNIIQPIVCAITPIELEHTEYLGNTIEKIAFEKAGIIKKDVPIITSCTKKEVIMVLKAQAKKMDAPFHHINDYLISAEHSYENNKMNIQLNFNDIFSRPIHTRISLLGDFQVQNAALACLAVKKALPHITEDCIERGLSKAHIQCRFEIIEKTTHNPTLILDGAHTVNSIACTLKTFSELYTPLLSNRKAHLLFACASDKNSAEIAQLFSINNFFSHITLTRPGLIKTADLPKLNESFYNSMKNSDTILELISDHEAAIEYALQKAKNENTILLATGSFYLLSEVKKILSKKSSSRE